MVVDKALRLLFFAGSARVGSLNKKLARSACELVAQRGIQATFIDLNDYAMPLYNADDETQHGLPQNVQRLQDLIKNHDGFFISCPEYNGAPAPLLINTLDWLSRRNNEQEKPLATFTGKIAALAAASPGQLGGLRGLPHVRNLLSNLGVTVIPKQVAIAKAHNAFDTNGQLTNANQQAQLNALLNDFIILAQAVKSGCG